MKVLIKQIFNCDIPNYILDDYIARAKRKLLRIIEREGDCEGKRLKDEYLAQLVIEEISRDAITLRCAKK